MTVYRNLPTVAGSRFTLTAIVPQDNRLAASGQRAAEQGRIVGDDAVNSTLREAFHVRGIVDGPDDNFLSGPPYFADQLRFGQVEAWNYILDRKFVPETELILELANQAQWNARVQSVCRTQRSRLKRREDESPAWLVPEEQVERYPFQTFDLEFYIEKRITISLQNVPQLGQMGKLLRWCAGDIRSRDLRIVADNCLFILG